MAAQPSTSQWPIERRRAEAVDQFQIPRTWRQHAQLPVFESRGLKPGHNDCCINVIVQSLLHIPIVMQWVKLHHHEIHEAADAESCPINIKEDKLDDGPQKKKTKKKKLDCVACHLRAIADAYWGAEPGTIDRASTVARDELRRALERSEGWTFENPRTGARQYGAQEDSGDIYRIMISLWMIHYNKLKLQQSQRNLLDKQEHKSQISAKIERLGKTILSPSQRNEEQRLKATKTELEFEIDTLRTDTKALEDVEPDDHDRMALKIQDEAVLVKRVFGCNLYKAEVCTDCATPIRESSTETDELTLSLGFNFTNNKFNSKQVFELREMIQENFTFEDHREINCPVKPCTGKFRYSKQFVRHAPEVLCIVLNRVGWNGRAMSKFFNTVRMDEILDLSEFYQGDQPPKYQLNSVINHSGIPGSGGGGHYTCFARQADGSWNYINEDSIEKRGPLEGKDLKSFKVGKMKLDMRFTPYILFFSRIFNDTADNDVDQTENIQSTPQKPSKFSSTIKPGEGNVTKDLQGEQGGSKPDKLSSTGKTQQPAPSTTTAATQTTPTGATTIPGKITPTSQPVKSPAISQLPQTPTKTGNTPSKTPQTGRHPTPVVGPQPAPPPWQDVIDPSNTTPSGGPQLSPTTKQPSQPTSAQAGVVPNKTTIPQKPQPTSKPTTKNPRGKGPKTTSPPYIEEAVYEPSVSDDDRDDAPDVDEGCDGDHVQDGGRNQQGGKDRKRSNQEDDGGQKGKRKKTSVDKGVAEEGRDKGTRQGQSQRTKRPGSTDDGDGERPPPKKPKGNGKKPTKGQDEGDGIGRKPGATTKPQVTKGPKTTKGNGGKKDPKKNTQKGVKKGGKKAGQEDDGKATDQLPSQAETQIESRQATDTEEGTQGEASDGQPNSPDRPNRPNRIRSIAEELGPQSTTKRGSTRSETLAKQLAEKAKKAAEKATSQATTQAGSRPVTHDEQIREESERDASPSDAFGVDKSQGTKKKPTKPGRGQRQGSRDKPKGPGRGRGKPKASPEPDEEDDV